MLERLHSRILPLSFFPLTYSCTNTLFPSPLLYPCRNATILLPHHHPCFKRSLSIYGIDSLLLPWLLALWSLLLGSFPLPLSSCLERWLLRPLQSALPRCLRCCQHPGRLEGKCWCPYLQSRFTRFVPYSLLCQTVNCEILRFFRFLCRCILLIVVRASPFRLWYASHFLRSTRIAGLST